MNRIQAVNLYVYTQPGCPACSKARPHIEQFRQAHPTIITVELDVSRRDWAIGTKKVKSTPQYVLVVNKETVWEHEGMLTSSQLNNVVKQVQEA